MPLPMKPAAAWSMTGAHFTADFSFMPAFIYNRRIAFHETDAAGVVYFANFFHLAEEAETHAIASLGNATAHNGFLYPRVHAEADYCAPLHFFDEVSVHCNILRIGSSSIDWKFDICHRENLCAVVKITSSRRNPDGSAAPYTEEEKLIYSIDLI